MDEWLGETEEKGGATLQDYARYTLAKIKKEREAERRGEAPTPDSEEDTPTPIPRVSVPDGMEPDDYDHEVDDAVDALLAGLESAEETSRTQSQDGPETTVRPDGTGWIDN